MFDIGMTELLLVAIVALIVVGPKDLPGMFRTLGRFTARAKSMAREFSSAMEQAADEAGVKDIAKTVKSATNPKAMGLDALKGAADKFETWDPAKSTTAAGKNLQTAEMTEARAETAKKISEATAKASSERQTAEAVAKPASGEAAPVVAPKKPAAKKAAPKKAAAKKPAAKKPAATKTAAKKPAAKKAAVKKPAVKKTAAKKAPVKAAKTATKDESAG
jgi:sec-independent protein translocase protein TatB